MKLTNKDLVSLDIILKESRKIYQRHSQHDYLILIDYIIDKINYLLSDLSQQEHDFILSKEHMSSLFNILLDTSNVTLIKGLVDMAEESIRLQNIISENIKCL